ncbi:MAG: 16S rRNA (cytosine(1402)-N(4))-methyltransferase RsmH [Prevotellaceae bacterium]|jgi:16S rRNA (cytosine1402-N4)-methyltransferase|nr:16S rRNA (cytosine(1402)-N(4))-methyltransferase RsmH [Prevotellaceae bacterium]
MSAYHHPVLLRESVASLVVSPNGTYVDATFGGGGHARAILEQLDNGHLYAFDRDLDAAANVPVDSRFTFVRNNFAYMQNCLRYLGCSSVDGIIADLGVSSHQFDTEERGFSYRFDSDVDMRMNRDASLSAFQVLNHYPEEELERIFRQYGELPQSRRAAALITKARAQKPIRTCKDFQSAIEPLIPRQHSYKFFSTLYQSIRIEVNGEMGALEALLEQSLRLLTNGGRLAVITYHSLEDRMVKNFMRCGNVDGHTQKDFFGNDLSPFVALHKKAITPSQEEIANNNRARSAKLRVAVKHTTS